ncbi:MAG: hypothetical protein ACOYOK_06840 [Pseudobdellovibrionaceae bacterium]
MKNCFLILAFFIFATTNYHYVYAGFEPKLPTDGLPPVLSPNPTPAPIQAPNSPAELEPEPPPVGGSADLDSPPSPGQTNPPQAKVKFAIKRQPPMSIFASRRVCSVALSNTQVLNSDMFTYLKSSMATRGYLLVPPSYKTNIVAQFRVEGGGYGVVGQVMLMLPTNNAFINPKIIASAAWTGSSVEEVLNKIIYSLPRCDEL